MISELKTKQNKTNQTILQSSVDPSSRLPSLGSPATTCPSSPAPLLAIPTRLSEKKPHLSGVMRGENLTAIDIAIIIVVVFFFFTRDQLREVFIAWLQTGRGSVTMTTPFFRGNGRFVFGWRLSLHFWRHWGWRHLRVTSFEGDVIWGWRHLRVGEEGGMGTVVDEFRCYWDCRWYMPLIITILLLLLLLFLLMLLLLSLMLLLLLLMFYFYYLFILF